MAPPVLAAVCGLDTALYHLFGSLQIPTPAHISLPPVVVYYHTPLPAPDTRLRFQLIYPLARGSFHLAFFLYYGVFSPCVIPFHTPSMFVPGRDGAILGGVSLVRHLLRDLPRGRPFCVFRSSKTLGPIHLFGKLRQS